MTLKKAVIFGLLLEILLGAAAVAFYFMYYIKTPTYSVNAIQKAIQAGDVEAVEARVDLDSVLQKGCMDISELLYKDDPMYNKLVDGSFQNVCKEDFLAYVKDGKWPENKEITEEASFQAKIGFRTMTIRSVEYIYKDAPSMEGEEIREDGSLLDIVRVPVLNHLNLMKKSVATDGSDTATAGIRIFEPNFGDTYLLRVKLRRLEDGNWQLYEVENYKEFVNELIKQNDRDLKRYKGHVKVNLANTQDKFNELRQREPEVNMDWLLEARKIMQESCQQLDELKVPIAGGHIEQLLKERKAIFLDMLDAYYNRISQREAMNEARDKAEEARKAGKKARFNENSWNQRMDKAGKTVDELNAKWADNKAKLEAIVGSTAEANEAAMRGARAMRNNDDAAVRAANYPGVENNTVGGEFSPVGGENLPAISIDNPQAVLPPAGK